MSEQRFTMVFEGDLREFKGNPLHAITDWGCPQAVGVGDAFAQNDALLSRLRKMEEALREIIRRAPGSGPLWFGSKEIEAARAALSE